VAPKRKIPTKERNDTKGVCAAPSYTACHGDPETPSDRRLSRCSTKPTSLLTGRGDVTLRRTLLAGVFSLVVAIGIGRFAYTPILPAMQARFDLSNAAAGALAASNYLGYLLGAVLAALLPTGRLQDTLLRVCLVLVTTATAAMAFTSVFPAWLCLRFLSGLAGAGIFVFASAAVLEELSRRDKKRLSGWFYSGVGLGIALSGLVVVPIDNVFARHLVWRADWLSLGVVAAAFVAICWSWLPESTPARDPVRSSPGRGIEKAVKGTSEVGFVRIPLVLALLCASYFLNGGGYIVTGTFLPVIVESLPGLSGAGAGFWVLVGLAAAPSTPVWSWVASKLGSPPALVLACSAQAAGIVLPVFSDAWWAAACSAALFGGTVMGIVALTLTYARDVVGASRASLVIGSLTAFYGVGQVLGPLVGAALAGGPSGFGPALVVASAAVGLGGLLMAVVRLLTVRVGRTTTTNRSRYE
jgi:predicted MFS family arabinose efflux permease